MPSTQQVPDIVNEVKSQLRDAEATGVHLIVSGERLDDDWLYIVVTPARAGVRASDHADLMARVERRLRDKGYENVLLVPALDD